MTVLPFYTSTGMRDAERVWSQDALLCPIHKFLPWQIQRDHLADTYLTEIKLVDCDAAETDVFDYFISSESVLTGWTNGAGGFAFDAFASSGSSILTAVETTSDTVVCYGDEFSLATGQAIIVAYDFTLGAGIYPSILLGSSVGTAYSTSTTFLAGSNTIYIKATSNDAGKVNLIIKNTGSNTDFDCTFSNISKVPMAPIEKTTYDFITYNGTPLSTTLPYGVYYLKASDGNTTWYSEWFSVQDLQPQLLTGWPTSDFDTFDYSGTSILTAIEVAGDAGTFAAFASVHTDEKFIFTYDLTLNSGAYPHISLYSGGAISDLHTLTDGLNEVEITSNTSSAAPFARIRTATPTSFSLGSVSLRRKAGDYVHLEFTNTHDFDNGDDSIYYAGGFTQQAYLNAYENLPSHETISIGTDKNGAFEAEKVVSKYTRSILSYETRAMYNALRLLPLHDSVKILDETGIEYTPSIGNIEVPPINWDTFDTGTLKIAFNEDGTVWTNSSDNIT